MFTVRSLISLHVSNFPGTFDRQLHLEEMQYINNFNGIEKS